MANYAYEGRFGYRVRAQPTLVRQTVPSVAPTALTPLPTERKHGACPGLDELWGGAAETFLLPAGGVYAAKSLTSTIHDQDKDRRPLVTGVGPHILAGLLGVFMVHNADHLQPKERKDLAHNRNVWWSRIRASILMVLDAQHPNARRVIHKYKAPTVARPPLHITKECALV
jgi:hypothetical protein